MTRRGHIKEHFRTLGISCAASEEEIKEAYFRLARKYHPDHNYGNPDAVAQFKEIQLAYEALSKRFDEPKPKKTEQSPFVVDESRSLTVPGLYAVAAGVLIASLVFWWCISLQEQQVASPQTSNSADIASANELDDSAAEEQAVVAQTSIQESLEENFTDREPKRVKKAEFAIIQKNLEAAEESVIVASHSEALPQSSPPDRDEYSAATVSPPFGHDLASFDEFDGSDYSYGSYSNYETRSRPPRQANEIGVADLKSMDLFSSWESRNPGRDEFRPENSGAEWASHQSSTTSVLAPSNAFSPLTTSTTSDNSIASWQNSFDFQNSNVKLAIPSALDTNRGVTDSSQKPYIREELTNILGPSQRSNRERPTIESTSSPLFSGSSAPGAELHSKRRAKKFSRETWVPSDRSADSTSANTPRESRYGFQGAAWESNGSRSDVARIGWSRSVEPGRQRQSSQEWKSRPSQIRVHKSVLKPYASKAAYPSVQRSTSGSNSPHSTYSPSTTSGWQPLGNR